MPSFKSVAVIGAGAWGTALAGVAARAGRDVDALRAQRRQREADRGDARPIRNCRASTLDAGIAVTADIAHARKRRHHPDRDAGAESARGGNRARAASRKGNAASSPAPRASSAARINS